MTHRPPAICTVLRVFGYLSLLSGFLTFANGTFAIGALIFLSSVLHFGVAKMVEYMSESAAHHAEMREKMTQLVELELLKRTKDPAARS